MQVGAVTDKFTIAVASGKGGTGKTLVSTNLAAIAEASGMRTTLVDCDVEAPNDHLFFRQADSVSLPVEAVVAEVDSSRCTACGACRNACAYGAARIFGPSAIVFDELCHGCGLCAAVCPADAIREVSRRVGEVSIAAADGRPGLTLVGGRLDVGQVKTPAVIRKARQIAVEGDSEVLVLDAPPGVACAAVASVVGADVLLLVAEATPFGLHDLELSMRLGGDLELPMGVVINRWTGSSEGELEALCEKYGATVLARIPFDRRVAEEYACGALVSETIPSIGGLLGDVFEATRGLAAAKATSR